MLKVGGLSRRTWGQVVEDSSLLVKWERERLSFKFKVILTYFCSSYLRKPWSSYACWFWAKAKRFKRRKMMIAPKMFIVALNSRILSYCLQNSCLHSTYFCSILCLKHWATIYVIFSLIFTSKICDFWKLYWEYMCGVQVEVWWLLAILYMITGFKSG